MSYLAAAKGIFGGGMGGGAGPSTSGAESGGSTLGGGNIDFGGIGNRESDAVGNAPIIIAAVAVTIFVVIGGVAIIRSK